QNVTVDVGVTINADGSYSIAQTGLDAIPQDIIATGTLKYTVKDDNNIDPATATDESSYADEKTLTINITGDNDAPVLDLDVDDSSTSTIADYQTTFKEGSGGVAIADIDSLVTDIDSAHLAKATITLTNAQTGDTFDLSGIDAKFNAALTGNVVTLTGDFSIADYQDAIEAVKFNNTSATPDQTDRIVTVTVDDGGASNHQSNTATTTSHVDATPTVNLDTDTAAEGQVTVTGNILTNDDTGTPTAKVTSFTYIDESGRVVAGIIGTEADTKYGKITLNGDGNYDFTSDLHEDHPVGNSLLDIINYTLTDGDVDTASTTLTIDVQDTIATITPATTITLDEDDLPAGSTPTPADLIIANTTLSITAGEDPITDVTFDLAKVQADAGMA
ncbi:MAG: VCBS domain-containing protein, partial [Deltaproteobacteria bacterium]|nr:VCBS domain-containing protein [Deltaproteobacteria bacterium]